MYVLEWQYGTVFTSYLFFSCCLTWLVQVLLLRKIIVWIKKNHDEVIVDEEEEEEKQLKLCEFYTSPLIEIFQLYENKTDQYSF